MGREREQGVERERAKHTLAHSRMTHTIHTPRNLAFSLFLNSPCIFVRNLSSVLNAEKAALLSTKTSFAGKKMRTLEALIEQIFINFVSFFLSLLAFGIDFFHQSVEHVAAFPLFHCRAF